MSVIFHPFKPVFNSESKIIILGSFPSQVSRNESFYYANKSNRFWRIMSSLFDMHSLNSIDNKTDFLLKNKIALYDSIYSCEVAGSLDISISNIKPSDIESIIKASNIKRVYTNGRLSHKVFLKYHSALGIMPAYLPSSSAANAKLSLSQLTEKWSIILNDLK